MIVISAHSWWGLKISSMADDWKSLIALSSLNKTADWAVINNWNCLVMEVECRCWQVFWSWNFGRKLEWRWARLRHMQSWWLVTLLFRSQILPSWWCTKSSRGNQAQREKLGDKEQKNLEAPLPSQVLSSDAYLLRQYWAQSPMAHSLAGLGNMIRRHMAWHQRAPKTLLEHLFN